MYLTTGALPTLDALEAVTVCDSGPGPSTLGRGDWNTQSGMVTSMYGKITPEIAVGCVNFTTRSAMVLFATRFQCVKSSKSAVNCAVAVGLSVSTGFGIRPPDPSVNTPVRSGMSMVSDPPPM